MSRSWMVAFAAAAVVTVSARAHDDPTHRIHELTRAIEREPARLDLRLHRADACRQAARWSDAVADCDHVITTDTTLAPRARYLKGRVLLASGEPEAALACVARLLEDEPNHARAMILGARSLSRLTRYDLAVAHYDKALSGLDDVAPDLHLERALARAGGGTAAHLADAVAGLDTAISQLGPVIVLEQAAIDLDIRRGLYDDSLDRLARIEQRARRRERWQSRRGDVLARAGLCDDARHAYKSALDTIERLPEHARRRPASASLEQHVVEALASLGSADHDHDHHGACGDMPTATLTTLIPEGAEWRYLDDGSDQGTTWQTPEFDDTSWSEGPAQLGYGDGDEATVISYGDDKNNKHITTYFRHQFMVDDPTAYNRVLFRVVRDDGAITYVNGDEVNRTNMPAGPVNFDTVASSTVSSADETWFSRRLISPSQLVAGQNTVAVELHQRAGNSSDTSFDFELLATDGPAFVTRGPYLQSLTPTSVVVRWRADPPVDGVVSYGTDPESLMSEVVDQNVSGHHEVTIEGLDPATTYYYAIGTSEMVLERGESYQFTTAPPPGSVDPIRIWAIGDSGTAKPGAADVREAYRSWTGETHTDVWLMLGDNAYNDGTESNYQAAVFDWYPEMLRRTPVWPTLGNHDAVSADSPTESGVYYNVMTLPRLGEAGGLASGTEAYYSFDYGNVHFICLDSHDTDRSPGGAMMTWIEADLADTLAEWIIAFWHHPSYTKGTHDSDDFGDSGGRMRDMRENALPILEQGGVDLVLAGHSHTYERSFLVDGHYGLSGTLTPDMIVDGGDGRVDGDGAYAKPPDAAAFRGAVYAVAGSSGALGSGPLNHPVMVVGLSVRGSLVIDVEGPRLDGLFLDASGNLADDFTIIRDFDPADTNLDGTVDVLDLTTVILGWGACPPPHAPCSGDIDGDGTVSTFDLIEVIVNWS